MKDFLRYLELLLTDLEWDEWYEVKFHISRSLQNQVYIAHSCLVGNPPLKGMEGWGKSAIMSPCEPPWNPNGVIVEANENEEAVITADLDLKLLNRKRKRASAPTLKDRRPEIYEL